MTDGAWYAGVQPLLACPFECHSFLFPEKPAETGKHEKAIDRGLLGRSRLRHVQEAADADSMIL